MKTHFPSGASDEKESPNRDLSCYYGLRENPKKTQKFAGSNSSEASMDHHSGTRKNLVRCKECGKGFRYDKCLTNHRAWMHSGSQSASEESRASLCGFSLVRRKRSRVNRYKKTRLSSFITFPEYLSVSATEEELQVVECLILLSESGGNVLDGLKLVGEALEAHSETPGTQDSWSCLSSKKPRTSGEFDHDETCKDKNTGQGSESEKGSRDNHQKNLGEEEESKRIMCLDDDAEEPGKSSPQVAGSSPVLAPCSDERRSFEHRCRTCDKTFSSYQALGGHQTLHRMRNKAGSGQKTERRRETGEPNGSSVEHKCIICSRVFKSVHALGGHKKCHHLRKSSKVGDSRNLTEEETYFGSNNGIDLNVPIACAVEQV
ncbi:PREDICTED: zinc finger protein ZAT9 [Tarenaya hassleriana]|uniref:zinc finger protein ZAT9 n=1 Tax=Tarenaya hassleriana TaxID=28532 RepID=UPI00053C4602|nr:PREDICTED: zinc finger protein ZAT9 [Tarenaya hassleriana]